MADLKQELSDSPDYVGHLEDIIEYEEEHAEPDHPYIEDTEHDCCWEATDVGVHPSTLYQMEIKGMIEKVFDTNSTTAYALVDKENAKGVIEDINERETEGIVNKEHEFPDDEEELDGVFDDVMGYEDVKWLIKRGMTTDDITNFLLVGPPGSAKSVFLMCIKELEGGHYLFGPDISSSGFNEFMFENVPRYICIDEMDDMDSQEQKSLSSYTETGIVSETKYKKDREMKTNAKTFAAANRKREILDHIRDRFVTLEFDPYTRQEYIDVCEHVLPRKEDKGKEESRKIAEALWERYDEGDVRRAIAVARLSRGDPEKVIGVLDDYSGSVLEGF